MNSFGIYFHIPFCKHKCPYCDFNTYVVNKIPEREYTEALKAELRFRTKQEQWRDREVHSIYFGGGTPSLLSPVLIEELIDAVAKNFKFKKSLEITLEANPGWLDREKLNSWKKSGITRLSFGSQSLSKKTLSTLGRQHKPEQVVESIKEARIAGFEDINLDLIYGVPDQTLEELSIDLKELIALEPTHISTYSLTIEKGTPFYQMHQQEKLFLPKEETSVAMLELIYDHLPANGYEHYEISNFSKSGYQALHNLAYWEGRDYLGLGAGAHSYFREDGDNSYGTRWANFAKPNSYIESAIKNGEASAWQESLSQEDSIFEFFFMGLRKTDGVKLSEFEERFGISALTLYSDTIDLLVEEGFLHLEENSMALTLTGLKLSDSILERFSSVPRITDLGASDCRLQVSATN